MKKSIINIMLTILFMCLSTFVLLLVTTFILLKLQIDTNKLTICTIIIYFVSTFIGGFIFGKIREKNKFLYGMMIGGMYFLVLCIVSAVCAGGFDGITAKVLYSCFTCVIGGMLGGMLS